MNINLKYKRRIESKMNVLNFNAFSDMKYHVYVVKMDWGNYWSPSNEEKMWKILTEDYNTGTLTCTATYTDFKGVN